MTVFSGEEISGSEGSGSEEMDEGEDEAGEGGERRRKRRGTALHHCARSAESDMEKCQLLVYFNALKPYLVPLLRERGSSTAA